MNPVLSSMASSCGSLAARSSLPSPKPSPKFSHMLSPPSPRHHGNFQARRSSADYKKQLAVDTSKAFKTKKKEVAKSPPPDHEPKKVNSAGDKNKTLLLDVVKEHKVAKKKQEKSAKGKSTKPGHGSGTEKGKCSLM